MSSKKNINIAVDHELRGRNISNALEKKIDGIKKPESLSSIEFINMIETFVKITNKGWQSLLMNLEIIEISKMGGIYLTNFNSDPIYSKFYGYNGSRVCISSDNLEIFK